MEGTIPPSHPKMVKAIDIASSLSCTRMMKFKYLEIYCVYNKDIQFLEWYTMF